MLTEIDDEPKNRYTKQTDRRVLSATSYHIRRLAVFGSALRPDFDQESDIDFLVEFDPDRIPGLFGVARYLLNNPGNIFQEDRLRPGVLWEYLPGRSLPPKY